MYYIREYYDLDESWGNRDRIIDGSGKGRFSKSVVIKFFFFFFSLFFIERGDVRGEG